VRGEWPKGVDVNFTGTCKLNDCDSVIYSHTFSSSYAKQDGLLI